MPSNRIELGEPPVSVRLNVNPRARRFTLRIGSPAEGPVLTLPPGVPLTEAERFLRRHAAWLTQAIARQPDHVPIGHGARLPIAGVEVEVIAIPGRRRAPELGEGRLVVSGQGDPGPLIAAWLRQRAREVLVPATHGYAEKLGRRVTAVSLRDTRSRWGSCSTTGRISYSWRLAMAPPTVLDYVAAHEAAHLVEMNHAPRFWAVVAELVPDYDRHRDWLKREGRRLHAFRFEANQAS